MRRGWFTAIIGVFFALLLSGQGGCPSQPPTPFPSVPPVKISRGIITATLSRYIERGAEDPFQQFSLMGLFVRHEVEAASHVETLLGLTSLDVDVPLDTCSPPAPVIDEARLGQPQGAIHVELLDVGDVSVQFGDRRKPVITRTFPDLLKIIVGVIYTADETQGVSFRPGERYSLRSSGSPEVAPFDVALDAPEDLGEVKVDGVQPEQQTPGVARGDGVALTWEGFGYGDEVIASLSWTSMGAPWSLSCRMRDDGYFVIPEAITTALPDPITVSDGELTISRTRQVAFRTNGLASGSFRFAVQANFPVKF